MGLFGKILLVLNLLLGGGFVYLALQDWSGRQAIAANGLRHTMLLEGVPFNSAAPDTLPARVQAGSDGYSEFTSQEIPFEVPGPGNVKTKFISSELLYAYFAGVGDSSANSLGGNMPVASQIAEIKRVFAILKAQDEASRAQFIGPALLRLAETFEERSDYLAIQGSAAELSHAMDLKFHRVAPELVQAGPLNPDQWNSLDAKIKELETQRDAAKKAADEAGDPAEAERQKAEAGKLTNRIERRKTQPKERQDEADRKFRLATLLVHLDTRPEWQKRSAMIVGMKQYVKAVDGQSAKFKEIQDRVEQATIADQERFVSAYAQLRGMAIQRTQLVLEMAEVRAQLTIQAQKDLDLVNQRQLQLEDLNAQLATIRAEVNVLLAKQTQTEQALFLIEREIGLKLEDIYRMEADLRKLEIERYEQKK